MASYTQKIPGSASQNAKRYPIAAATRIVVTRIDVPFQITFDDDSEPVSLGVGDVGFEYKVCGGNPITAYTITIAPEDIADATEIHIWQSSNREIKFPKADAASAAARTYLTVIAPGAAAVIEQVSGQSAGQNKFDAVNVTTAIAPATAPALALISSATRIGSGAAQQSRLTHYVGIHPPTLFNNAAIPNLDYGPLNGQRLVMEADLLLERSALVTGRVWAFFGIGATGANPLNPNMLGFIFHDGPGGNPGFPTSPKKWHFGYYVYNSAGNWTSMKAGNVAAGGGIVDHVLSLDAINAAVGVAGCSDTVHRFRLEIAIEDGEPQCIGYIDGEEVGRIAQSDVPFMSAEARATVGQWYPEIRTIRESGGEYCMAMTHITSPEFSLWMEPNT